MLEQSGPDPLSSVQTTCRLTSQMVGCSFKLPNLQKLHNSGRKPENVRTTQKIVSFIGTQFFFKAKLSSRHFEFEVMDIASNDKDYKTEIVFLL